MSELERFFAQNGTQAFLGYTQILVALIDSQGNLLEWNPAFASLKAARPSATLLQDFLTESSRSRFCEMINSREPGQSHLQQINEVGGNNLICLLTPLSDGKTLFCAEPICMPWDKELIRLKDELEKIKRTLHIKKIELEAVLMQADEISHTDSLTFLSNRRRIIADLQREVSSCDRYRKPLTIFMADIDHFKHINDTSGHAAGDQVLRALAGEMFTSIREIDKLGRYGGEEFLFILPATSKKTAQKIADRLLATVRSLDITINGDQFNHVTISIGIAQYKIGKESWEDLLNRADKALYESKANGRDRWTVAKFG